MLVGMIALVMTTRRGIRRFSDEELRKTCTGTKACTASLHHKGCPMKQSRLRTLLGVVERPERL